MVESRGRHWYISPATVCTGNGGMEDTTTCDRDGVVASHRGSVYAVSVHPHARSKAEYWLASAGEDDVVQLTRIAIADSEDASDDDDDDDDDDEASAAAHTSSASEKLCVVTRDDSERAVAVATRHVVELKKHTAEVVRVCHSPFEPSMHGREGPVFVTGGADGVAFLWETPNEEPIARLGPHDEEVYGVDIVDPGVIVCAAGDRLHMWDVASAEATCVHAPDPPRADAQETPDTPDRWSPGYVFDLAIAPSAAPTSPTLAACPCSDGRVRVWSVQPSARKLHPVTATDVIAPGAMPTCAAFVSDTSLAVGMRPPGGGDHLCWLDARMLGHGAVAKTPLPPGGVHHFLVDRNGSGILTACQDGSVRRIMCNNPEELDIVVPPRVHGDSAPCHAVARAEHTRHDLLLLAYGKPLSGELAKHEWGEGFSTTEIVEGEPFGRVRVAAIAPGMARV